MVESGDKNNKFFKMITMKERKEEIHLHHYKSLKGITYLIKIKDDVTKQTMAEPMKTSRKLWRLKLFRLRIL